jgi:hypothetical protein
MHSRSYATVVSACAQVPSPFCLNSRQFLLFGPARGSCIFFMYCVNTSTILGGPTFGLAIHFSDVRRNVAGWRFMTNDSASISLHPMRAVEYVVRGKCTCCIFHYSKYSYEGPPM